MKRSNNYFIDNIYIDVDDKSNNTCRNNCRNIRNKNNQI